MLRILLFAAGVTGSFIRRRRPSTSLSITFGGILVLLGIGGAIGVRAAVTLVAESLGIDVTHHVRVIPHDVEAQQWNDDKTSV
ncbi:MAG TPA: hypothetical protein VHI98_24785 [Vicinamibacterales bacterium]|nr:hypothetical protein [Vicinamibacterales bacterium]